MRYRTCPRESFLLTPAVKASAIQASEESDDKRRLTGLVDNVEFDILVLAWFTSPRGVARRSRMAQELDAVFEMVAHFQKLAEHEKAALARELHDELGGFLISAVMDLSILSPRVADLGEDAKEKMRRLREALQSAIGITRRITEELRPTMLDNVGLFAALRWQLKQVCARSKINCTDDLPASELRLTPAASIALFRSAQEALLVGLEREGVTAIALAGKVHNSALFIQIKGDGANLIDEHRTLGHVTLESIRHRIRALGGELNIEHPPNGGIVVAVCTPIANVLALH